MLQPSGYVDYLVSQHAAHPEWRAEHTEWLRRFSVSGRVLDCGSGLGHLAQACASAGVHCVGAEPDGELVKASARLFPGSSTVQASGTALPFSNESFDWVLSNQVIEHVAHGALYLTECRRVLVRNGHLLITTPNRRTHFATRRPAHIIKALRGTAKIDPTHVHEYTPEEIRLLVKQCGFVVEHEEMVGRLHRSTLLHALAGGVLLVARRV